MLYGQIERELVDGEYWFFWQQPQLPHHLQRLVEQEQGRRDIWESPPGQEHCVQGKEEKGKGFRSRISHKIWKDEPLKGL